MNEYLRTYPGLKAIADEAIDPALERLRATDRELAAMLNEFEAIRDGGNRAARAEALRGEGDEKRDRDLVNVAAWIGGIKMSRDKIRAITGDQ
jgi:hypothetical protein